TGRKRQRDLVPRRDPGLDQPPCRGAGTARELGVIHRAQGASLGVHCSRAQEPVVHGGHGSLTRAVAIAWESAGEYKDIRYELSGGADAGIAKITINRPEVRNAFRPETVIELSDAFTRAREDEEVGVVILTGEGPDAFCSGGDQRVRGQR